MRRMLVEIADSRCPPASGVPLAAGFASTSATGRRGPTPGAAFAFISVTPSRVGRDRGVPRRPLLRLLSSLVAQSANLAASKAQPWDLAHCLVNVFTARDLLDDGVGRGGPGASFGVV